MNKSKKNVSKLLFTGIITIILLLAGSCQNWMSNDDFMSKIEGEVHDANASVVNVYVRYANVKMGTTEPQGNTTMKVDVSSSISAVTSEEYGFVKWAAFSSKDFATNKQHSSLIYLGEQEYNANFKNKELPASVIEFSKPDNPVTDVKIKENRGDIFIIPIVAARPTYVQSVPANADYNVVKNTSIRILFSKAIDKTTLLDSEGNYNYSITSSAAVLTDDDNEMEAKDITELFDYTLSDSGKMLTLNLKKGEDGTFKQLLDNRQRITVTLFEGICDKYGYTMNGNYTFSFQTGTNTDSLAPMIEVLVAGKDVQSIGSYVSLKHGEIDGKATNAAKAAPRDITGSEYTDSLVAQRVFDKLYIYVKANDVIASGNAEINPAKDLSEDNVAYIGISAALYVDKDGKAVSADAAQASIARKNNVYIAGQVDSSVQTDELFTDIVPLDKDGVKYAGGTIFTYDVSSLPDGLIKIDVWGIDMVGNTGLDEKSAAAYYTKHDNGYKSIFIVKDTTAPDSKTEAKKIISNSESAPYYWYNSETLSTMKLYDDAANDASRIEDTGHIKLRSLAKNLSWNFVVGKNPSTPAANDKGWKTIHDTTTGASIKYELKDAKAPEKDGPVDITLYIRDDIGNVSEPVLLNSVMYDNTKPTVTLLDNYGDFVNENGGKELHSSKNASIDQILKVKFTEPNVDETGSGIRRIEIHVKKGNEEVTVPLTQSKFKVKYSAAADATPATANVITIDADDTASTDTLKVFKVNDKSKITTGTLFIYGLTLGEEDGDYTVSVDLYDSAMNKTTATAKTLISRDKTSPVINKVKVVNAKARVVYGDTTETKTWWMPKELYENGDLTKVSLDIDINESGSGLEFINVGSDVEFTAATKLKKGTEYLVKGTDYEFDTTDQTHIIRLLDNYRAKLKAAANTSFVITLENVKLKSLNTSTGNKVNISVTDFVKNNPATNKIGSTNDYKIYYDDTTTGTVVFADNTAPAITSAKVEDSEKNSNPDNIAWDKNKYTDSQNIILTINLAAENTSNGSGVKKVTLTDNAVFTDTTVIKVDGTVLPSTKYTFAADKKSVEFANVFTAANVLTFTNVKIALNNVQGTHLVKTDLTDFVGLNTTASTNTNSIVWDQTNPVVSSIIWVREQDGVTVGTEKDWVVDTQSLKIDFTETTAGVKVIKFNIHLDENTQNYSTPFADASFELYYGDTKLVKDTDYTINSNAQYIVLNEPKTTGSFKFKNLKLSNTDSQGTYVVDVVLLDAAENIIKCTQSIAVDKIKPVITEVLSVPDLIHSVELTTNGGTKKIADPNGTGHQWLPAKYVGTGNNKKADSIPVYFTINEVNSGVKVITFSEDAVLTSKTELYTVGANNAETKIDPGKIEVDTTNQTITIKNSLDALKSNSNFKIVVKNVGFKNLDTEDAVSANTIKAKVADVALNESDVKNAAYQTIYADSRKPAAAQNLLLVDRTTTPIKAAKGFTNESIVNMQFDLTDSEATGSGYHKFTISGATFTNNTNITMKDENEAAIEGIAFEISNEGKTLTLKNSQNLLVIRQKVKVEITNIQLNNAGTRESKSVNLTCYDLSGWDSPVVTNSITFDDTKPSIVTGPYAAAYTNGPSYYVPSVNVYPHANGETAYGISVAFEIDETTHATVTVPTFYTSTTYVSGKSTSAGTVSAGADYGAVIGIRATDTTQIAGFAEDGDERARTFLYYVTDNTLSMTAEQIITSSSKVNPQTDQNGSRSSGTTKTSQALMFGLKCGKYSAVVVDEAGNVSDAFHFAIVQDTTQPVVTDMQNRVLLQRPEGANIYRNAQVAYTTKSTSFDFAAAGYGSSSPSIRTKKYVTKDPGSTNKYKIILNLGNAYAASSDITKIGGGTPSTTVTKYGEFTSTASAVKIEQYAISTWYGAFPTGSTSTYTYQPVPPYETSYPNGDINNASSTSSTLATNARDYFGYSTSFSSYWHAGSGNTSWHSYSHPNGADGTKVTDSGNGIVSYIDKNDNLIIEIPNTGFTAPISVFLRDGCGNMNYVVLGQEGSGTTLTVPSFVVDDKFSNQTTTNGYITTPVIVQNPHLTTPAASTNKTAWNGMEWDWGNQGGNANKNEGIDGVAETFGFIKDKTKNATYYNPRIYIDDDNRIQAYTGNTNKSEWPKLALTMQNHSENVIFSSGGKVPIVGADKDATPDSALDYTCRALLYCTTQEIDLSSATNYPTVYNMIVNSHKEGSVASGDTGFRTEWIGVKQCSTDQITILLDYPQPDYATLGWTVNDSNTHEPIPYYIWYVFEDRVGNYEIGKVVNSTVKGDNLKTKNHTGFDLWLYDGEAPLVTVVGTEDTTHPNGKKPNEIGNNKDEVDKLISVNNGYVPYLDTANNRVWVSINTSRSSRGNNLIKSTTGWGVTNTVEDDTNGDIVQNRSYLPFVNLQVAKEITGIRAFCWSTSETPPAYTASVSDNNTQGDRIDDTYPDGAWFAGNGTDRNAKENLPATKFDIGWGNYDYRYEGNKYLSTTNYNRKYTGTKINTVLSHKLITTSADSELYLHVMDWTGNVVSYRMGSTTSGLKFRNDTSYPVKQYDSFTEDEQKEKIKTVDGEYYVNTNGSRIEVRIAGEGDKAKAEQPIKIQLNSDYFTDNTGCGFGGISFNNNDFYTIKNNLLNGEPYLELNYSTYSQWQATRASDLRVYFYDKVGNLDYWGVNFYFDNEAPEYDSVSVVTLANSSTEIADPEHGLITNTVSGYGKVWDYDPRTASKHEDISFDNNDDSTEVQKVYLNKINNTRFHINLASDIADLSDIKINKWNGSKWANVTSWKESPDDFAHSGAVYAMNSYTKLSLNSNGTGTYYQIVATDLSGNASYQYFKLYLDNTGPELVARTDSTSKTPTIELGKGSIGKETSNGTDTYYYTAAEGKELKINFAMKDAGLLNSKQKFYYSFDDSKYTEISSPSDGLTNVTAKITSGTIQKLYLKDIFGNKTTLTPGSGANADFEGYKYFYGANNSSSKTMTMLTSWSGTPSTPSISVGDSGNISTSANYNDDGWDKTHTKKSDEYSTDKTIIITSKDRRQLKVEFSKPASEKIIGYLVTDEAGNAINNSEYYTSDNQYATQSNLQRVLNTQLSAVPNSNIGAYNFSTGFSSTFNEWLPLLINNGLNDAKEPVTRNYYAVDIVGNISAPLTVVYSYSDANHQATDIKLIQDYDTGIQTDAKELIDADIANGTIKLAQIVNNNGTWFFNGDFLLLECTLKNKAISTNNDTPTKVELRDIWGGEWADEAVRGYASEANNTNGTVFKVYPSDNTVSGGTSNGRYYCYIAFKVGNDVGSGDNKVWSLAGFYNNDQWGGSQLYAKIFGKSGAESDATSFNPEVSGAGNKPRWKRDIEGPVIGSYYVSGSNVYHYTPSTAISVVYDKDNNNNWDGKLGKTNSYTKGLTITIPASNSGITDGFKYTGDNGSINTNDFVNYSGVAQYRTVVTGTGGADSGWKDLVADDNENYQIPIPDVTTVHSEIKLYFKDVLGNESSEYKIGHKDDAGSAWWILNNLLTDKGTTVAAAANWAADTDAVFNVKPPAGSIIKSVGVKVNTTEITDATVSFAGYDGNPSQAMSNGWITLSADGLTVTVPKKYIKQDWNPKSVTITLNGTLSKTVTDFVPAKTFGDDDITLSAQTWESGTEVKIPFTLNNGADISKITSFATDTQNVTITKIEENGQNKFKLTGDFAKTWSDQVINIIINGSITKKALTIPSFKLGDHDDDITWSEATWVSGTASYDIPITLGTDVPVSKLTGITVTASGITNVQAALNLDDQANPKFVLSGVPTAQTWDDQVAKISISGDSVNETINKNAITVPARLVKANNITWGTSPTWNASTNEYAITITLVKGDALSAPDINKLKNMIYKVSIDGTVNDSIKARLSTSQGNKIKFTDANDILKTQKWLNQTVSINISGTNIDGTISHESLTIPAKKITGNDFSLTPATWASGNDQNTEYTIKVALNGGENAPPIDTFAAGLTVKQNTTSLTASWVKDEGGAYVLDDGKYQLKLKNFNVTQSWSEQNISVSITGTNINSTITANVLNVPAKEAANYITVTPTNPTAWAENTSSVTFTVAKSDSNLTISKVLWGENELTKKDNAYTITAAEGSTIAQNVSITVKTNHGDVTKRIFPVSGDSNRFFGRSFNINSASDGYTFSNAPGAVVALQSRIIELPDVVQKAWETFTTQKEEITSVAAPAKKAEETVAKAVKEVASSLEIIELPAETLVKPAVEDQVALLLPKTASEDSVAEPQASVNTGALEVSVTEAEPAEHSNTTLWIILVVFCAAIAGIVLCLKKKRV